MNRAPFFCDPVHRKAFLAEARSWLGTPFHAHGNIKGVGVDCVHVWAEVMKAVGVFESYEFPPYQIDQGNHLQASPVEDWLKAHPRFETLAFGTELIVGDLCAYRFGRVPFHLAGCIGWPHGIHILQGGRVTEMRHDDSTFLRRFTGAFRAVL